MNRSKTWMLVALLAALPVPGFAAEPAGESAVAKGIVKVSPDTYLIHRAEKPFVSHAKIKNEMQRDAEVFADQQGKVVVPVAMKENTRELNQYYTAYSWDYTFKLADRPQAAGTAAPPAAAAAPAAVAASAPAVPAAPNAPSAAAAAPSTSAAAHNVDVLYEQLLKLDDLRKKGILTEEEFQAQKKKLLDAN